MTLVEIMITLIISSIIAASTFTFFAGQQRVYETQTHILNIQHNLWAAMEVLSRHVRGAGSGMYECVRPSDYANSIPTSPASLTGGRLQTTTPSDGPHTSGGVLITSLATRPQAGLRAFDGTSGMQWIPPLWIVNNSTSDVITVSGTNFNVVPGTDIVTVAFGNRASGADVDGPLQLNVSDTDASIPITLLGATAGSVFHSGEFLLLMQGPNWGYGNNPSSDRGCTLLQVTSITGGNLLQHASGSGVSVWNPAGSIAAMLPASGGYTGAQDGVRNFGTLTWVTFFIQNDPATVASGRPVPQLMMQRRDQGSVTGTPQVLADGIEDLQVSFACDVGPLGAPDLTALNGVLDEGTDAASKRNDEWVNNVPGDVFPTNPTTLGFCNMPTAVRLTLVARSTTRDDLIDVAVTNNQPQAIEDNPCAASACARDQFRRRVLSTTVYPRNNKPL